MMPIDRRDLVVADELQGEDEEDTHLLGELHDRAKAFLAGFRWCKSIRASWFGVGIGRIFAVFLFEIEPALDEVDAEMWVVVGDMPSAIIVPDESPDPLAALKIYVREMREWVTAVRSGDPAALEACLPISARPTLELAAALEGRMNFLEREVYPYLLETDEK
jgi:hypothetical protein